MIHNKIKTATYLILPIFLLASCGAKNENLGLESNWENSGNWVDPKPELTKEVNEYIQNKLSPLPACTSENTSSDPNCALFEIPPHAAKAKVSSLGYRVMIIDDDGMIPAAYTRYRGRVLKNYFEDETTGQLKETTISIKIPRAAKEILLDTFQNPAYEKMPSELLRPSSKIFREKFSDMIYSLNLIGHSTLIFNYIANNSPNSQFVLIDSGMNKFNQIFCSNDLSEKEKINNISDLFKSQSDDIIEIINKYKINFISYSRGFNYERLKVIADKKIDGKIVCFNTSSRLIAKTDEVYFKSF